MIVKFNPTGTHIHNGFLKVRLDLYPEVGDKTYPIHYVDKYDREPTEEEWADEAKLALIPIHKELNPCLCHFVKVNPDIKALELGALAKTIFDNTTKLGLDDALSRGNTQKVSEIMRLKCGTGERVLSADIGKINTDLQAFEVKV